MLWLRVLRSEAAKCLLLTTLLTSGKMVLGRQGQKNARALQQPKGTGVGIENGEQME